MDPLMCHTLNAPCLYIKNWPECGSLEQKHAAKLSVIDNICVVFGWIHYFITLYNTTWWLLSKSFKSKPEDGFQ